MTTTMFNEVIKKIEWSGKTLELSFGKVARQADASVMVRMGETAVLCTTVTAKHVKEGTNFFPLTVHYREMAFAAGKIPGGFFKSEGKASRKEVLVSRLIDRPIRPLFPQGFFNETQVVCTVLSYDSEAPSDILAIIGASAALAVSGVPFLEIIAASKVGYIDDKFVLNPSFEQLKTSKLDLVVAGTKSSVMMVESEAKLLTEEKMLEAVKFGHDAFVPVIKMIEELVAEAGKEKWPTAEFYPASLKAEIRDLIANDVKHAFGIRGKQERGHALGEIGLRVRQKYLIGIENPLYSLLQIEHALEDVKSDILRYDLLEKNIRIDNRRPQDIRQIECEVSLLPRTHGSALFTRGETQSIVTVTLGTGQDEQLIDSLDGEYKEHFMLNYIFPPYSVGEASALRAPSRREVGHGMLAWRALNPVLPSKDKFPYTMRVVSEITESNGSSSQATVCGGSMALMDAGVPLLAPVSGIAMGLIKEGDKFVILSDILGDEDHLGDMDFKVAGTKEAITALQMDIKVTGITFEIMEKALAQAKEGRIHILAQMEKAISTSNLALSSSAPTIESFKVNKDKIREIIGPGGKVIREICETTGAKIDISDEGVVSISAIGRSKLEAAIARVKAIAFEPEVGDIFNGKVVKIMEGMGAFVNIGGSGDTFLHISEISNERIDTVSGVLAENDIVKVKIIGFDNRGKAKVTMKNLDSSTEPQPKEKSEKTETAFQSREKKDHKDHKDHNGKNNDSAPRKSSQNKTPEEDSIKERKYFN